VSSVIVLLAVAVVVVLKMRVLLCAHLFAGF